jgi:hypothetical protein
MLCAVAGYWMQPLLWLLDAHVLFLSSDVVHDRNAHDYHEDFVDEVDLYVRSGQLVHGLVALFDGIAQQEQCTRANSSEQRCHPETAAETQSRQRVSRVTRSQCDRGPALPVRHSGSASQSSESNSFESHGGTSGAPPACDDSAGAAPWCSCARVIRLQLQERDRGDVSEDSVVQPQGACVGTHTGPDSHTAAAAQRHNDTDPCVDTAARSRGRCATTAESGSGAALCGSSVVSSDASESADAFTRALFDCAVHVTAEMAREGFWAQQQVAVAEAWFRDLFAIGYRVRPRPRP